MLNQPANLAIETCVLLTQLPMMEHVVVPNVMKSGLLRIIRRKSNVSGNPKGRYNKNDQYGTMRILWDI